jgi:putative YphP/YqiW family bacilliredoxin
MNFQFNQFNLFNDVAEMARKEMVEAGYEQLITPEDVDTALKKPGTTLVMSNSVCGCAGGIARPAASFAPKGDIAPDNLVTVFAGQDKEATETARSYFTGYPPSSPSFALLKDGEMKMMVERHEIEGSDPMEVVNKLRAAFKEYC